MSFFILPVAGWILASTGCIKNNDSSPRRKLVQNVILISIGLRNITPICSLWSPHYAAQYCRHYLHKSDSLFSFRCVLLVMSGTLLGNHFSHYIQKVVAISVLAGCYQQSCLPFMVFGCRSINSGNIFMKALSALAIK